MPRGRPKKNTRTPVQEPETLERHKLKAKLREKEAKLLRRGRISKYKPKYCQEIVDMQSKGMTIYEIASVWGVHFDTIYEWRKLHPAFAEAFVRARQNLRAWFDKLAREKAIDIVEDGNSARLNDRTFKFMYWLNFKETENSVNSCVNLPEIFYTTKDIDVKQEILDQQLALNLITTAQYESLTRTVNSLFDRKEGEEIKKDLFDVKRKLEKFKNKNK
jgi:hypothetical protein